MLTSDQNAPERPSSNPSDRLLDLADIALSERNRHLPFPDDDLLYQEPPSQEFDHFVHTPDRCRPLPHSNPRPSPQYGTAPPVFSFHPYPPLSGAPAHGPHVDFAPSYFVTNVAAMGQHSQMPPLQDMPVANKRALSTSPQKPSSKRGRARSRGSRGGRGGHASRGGPSNMRIGAAEPLAQSNPLEELVEDDDIFAIARWTDIERGELFQFYLGPDSDDMFRRLQTNAVQAHKKAARMLFNQKYTAEAIKGQWMRALDQFHWMLTFETFTGGGGDGDEAEEEDEAETGVKQCDKHLAARMDRARAAGRALGSLSIKMYQRWQENGWYDLFYGRLGNSSKVTRAVVRNSVAPLSDTDETTLVNSDEDTTKESSTSRTYNVTRDGTKASRRVSEPRHHSTPLRAKSHEALASMNSINEYLELKMRIEEQRLLAMKTKDEITKAERARATAQLVLSLPNVRDDVRQKANDVLLNQLDI